ncbi:SAM-dependent methyltransferase [Mycobacterium liflandii 128FXT]|uniref:SAM-dependent methyltransferase n=1 Tax=Mycobacterium liflandii (strain 128FXT) TaxID=459424 RepID=L7V8V5_MYCL1|nr:MULTISPECIES: class I SAM-dependent methyltransferase [Mycobacterium ulcerans group]AGC62990.1 SAM-dependent methyltransferase [Mycobacterium liflandii 128FXT]
MRILPETTSVTEYYGHKRPEMLRFLPADAQCVLELGCGEGVFGAIVKQSTGAEVWGLEYNEEAAQRAGELLDHVLAGDASTRIAELPDNYFDAVVCNDVLEHLVDPLDTLKRLRTKLKPDGVVVASIPNIRYLPALGKVVFRRDFPQEDFGIFDRTHLRFFTRSSMVRMFEDAGFSMQRIKGINPFLRPFGALFVALSLGHFADGVFLQYACVATPAS